MAFFACIISGLALRVNGVKGEMMDERLGSIYASYCLPLSFLALPLSYLIAPARVVLPMSTIFGAFLLAASAQRIGINEGQVIYYCSPPAM